MKNQVKPVRPPCLKPGDLVACYAPASPFRREDFEQGVRLIQAMGYAVRYDPGIFSADSYLAGDDERRLNEIHRSLEDPEVKALWSARGGYGSMRLLEKLNFPLISHNPKIWLGFSDVSVLHLAIFSSSGLSSFHSPQVVSLPAAPRSAVMQLEKLLSRAEPLGEVFPETGECWRAGQAEGVLLPANLTMLCNLLGTPWMPRLHGCILAIEDVNEEAYRIDRMLTHLELAGALEGVAGFVAGRFTLGGKVDLSQESRIRRRLVEVAEHHQAPVLGTCPFGHIDANHPMPAGVRARLDADNGRLQVIEAATAP